MQSARRRMALLLALPALLTIGYAVPRRLISNGVERFRADPVEHAVAQAAHAGAWRLNDNPIGRLLFPRARVERVWREPGHCRYRPQPHPPGPAQGYRAEVRTYGWFGVPGPRVRVSCGGWHSSAVFF